MGAVFEWFKGRQRAPYDSKTPYLIIYHRGQRSTMTLSTFCSVLASTFLPLICYCQPLSFGPLGFGLGGTRTTNPCDDECECYDLETPGGSEPRFVVKCQGMKYGLMQGMSIPKNLPINTTDLIVSEYLLGTLSMSSFPNYDFPLNPMLRNVYLKDCHISYLSFDTFKGNSFIAIKNVTLNQNLFELIVEGTFNHLPIENIAMDRNFLQKVQKLAFRNLPQVHTINLSHNSITEIQHGAFNNLPLLTTLDLSYNWLTRIPGEDISQLPSLKCLNLDYNTWNCSCEMSWIVNFSSILNGSQAMCLYPSTLNGTALHQLTIRDFEHCFASESPFRGGAIIMLGTPVLAICVSVFWWIKQSNSKRIRQIIFDPKDILASKNNVTVYRGRLADGRLAAIKEYPRLTRLRELDVCLHLSKSGPLNPNIIQYLCVETDFRHTYIALELCDGNLVDLLSDHKDLHSFLTPECCLIQIARGMEFLHKQKVEHRDIKPQNILWRHSDSAEIRFIISDFDLSHLIKDESSGLCGSMGWTAPELWNRGEVSTATDLFSLGCVFYFVLRQGGHPFGSVDEPQICQNNIIDEKFKPSFEKLNEYHSDFTVALAEDLIKSMIDTEASKRSDAGGILSHPLFWKDSQLVDFYHKIGNLMEDMKLSKIKDLKDNLELNAATVFHDNWKDKLDKIVRSDVKRFKENEVCGLLRVIRNKIEHYGRLGEELRAIYSNSPQGVVKYYNDKFPKLLVYTYHQARVLGIEFD